MAPFETQSDTAQTRKPQAADPYQPLSPELVAQLRAMLELQAPPSISERK